MKIRCSAGTIPEVDVVATPGEYARLAAGITQLAAAGTGDWAFTAETGVGDQPTGRAPSEFRVRVKEGPLTVSIEGDSTVLACGGTEALVLLARNLPTESSLPPNYHVHYERGGREQFVSVESVPLVLIVAAGNDG